MISEWQDRDHGGLSFRVTQVLSGHVVFGEFLCRRNREWTPNCWLCGAAHDTAQHTLAECPVFAVARHALTAEIGEDVLPAGVVRQMPAGETEWRAVTTFCEEVMALMERSERDRDRYDPGR